MKLDEIIDLFARTQQLSHSEAKWRIHAALQGNDLVGGYYRDEVTGETRRYLGKLVLLPDDMSNEQDAEPQ